MGDDAAPLDAACALFAIPMRPEWREAALAHWTVIATAARFVSEFPLDDEAEPAPIFTP